MSYDYLRWVNCEVSGTNVRNGVLLHDVSAIGSGGPHSYDVFAVLQNLAMIPGIVGHLEINVRCRSYSYGNLRYI